MYSWYWANKITKKIYNNIMNSIKNYLSIYLSVCLSVFLSICLSIYMGWTETGKQNWSNFTKGLGFASWQIALKMFPDYWHYKDEIIWPWHFLLSFDICSSTVYLATTQSQCLILKGRDRGLNALCHSCGFLCQ